MKNQKLTYSEKLKDPRWQKKRLEILQRDNWTCQLCFDKETTLNIHHKEYFGEPWEASAESLTTLCQHCHGLISSECFSIFKNPISIHKRIKTDYIFYAVKLPGCDITFFRHIPETNTYQYELGISKAAFEDIISFYKS